MSKRLADGNPSFVKRHKSDWSSSPDPVMTGSEESTKTSLLLNPLDRLLDPQTSALESDYESDMESGLESELDSETEEVTDTAGIIEKISLTNFMCHDLFELELGPRLNFIIGRNGSGKSAVITGISVGLGARASDTNRGSSIQDLIKDGRSVAKIQLTFKNKGRDSYKPEIYGDHLTIERRLTRKPGASYFIKDENMRTISTKKADIDDILLKYNIRVDNPLAFLSQDKAREFLTSTGDSEKYNYFMAGILITDIIKNYEDTSNHLKNVSDKLDSAKSHLKTANDKLLESKKTYDKFRQSDMLRRKLELLNGKIFWYNVNKIEMTMEKRRNEIKEYESKIVEIDSEIQTRENDKKYNLDRRIKVEDEIKQLEQDQLDCSYKLEPAKVKRDQLKAINDTKMTEIKINTKKITENESEITRLTEELEREQTSLENDNEGDKRRRLTESKELLVTKKSERRQLSTKLSMYPDNVQEHHSIKSKITEYDNKKQELDELTIKISKLKEALTNRFGAFHPNIKHLMSEIDRTQWRDKPIGPLGTFIKVKDGYEKWKDLLNAVLQKTLNSFLVTNEEDRRKLVKLLRDNNLYNNIIVRRNEKFNFQSGKPINYTTFMDVLEFSDDKILYTMIDINTIEKSVITESDDLNLLVTKPNVQNVFSLVSHTSGRRTTGNDINIANDPVYYNRREPHKFSINVKDIDLEIADTQNAINTEKSQLSRLHADIQSLIKELITEKKDTQRKLKENNSSIKSLEDEILKIENELENGNDEMLDKISLIRSQIDELKDNSAQSKGISISLAEEIKSNKEEYRTLKSSVREIETELAEIRESLATKKEELQNLKDLIINFESDVSKLMNEKSKAERLIEHCNLKINSLMEKLDENKQGAERICKREEIELLETDTAQSIQEEYLSTQKAVEEAEQVVGTSYEEALSNYDNFRQKASEAEDIVRELQDTFNKLTEDLNTRLTYLKTSLEINIKEASNSFEESLDSRNFKGKLLVDPAKKIVTMMVAPQSASKARTVESLSGGEKSFTQVAFLLSIWKIMKSKIRGLDEFDVFMDSVNRTISIRLLLEELRKSPNSQTIFITPQDITNLTDLSRSDCMIHRMSNPRDD